MVGADDFEMATPVAAPAPQTENDGFAPIPTGNAPVLSPTAQTTFGNAMTYGLPGLGAGLLDTLGQSLHIFHDKTVENTLKSLTGDGPDTFGDFYSANKPQLRTGGEIAGMFIPGLAAMKILKTVQGAREAGSLGAILKNSTALNKLMGNSADLAAAENAVASTTKAAALDAGIWAGKTVTSPAVKAAKQGYYAKRAVDAARTTVAFELGNYAAFNSSETFYPSDATAVDQAKWMSAGLGVGVALDAAMARFAVRNIIQASTKAVTTGATGAAADVFGISPLAKDVDKTLFRPASRGIGITQFASIKADLIDTIKVSGSPTLKTNLTQDIANIDKTLSEQLDKMAYDTHPFVPRISLSPAQKQLGVKALDNNPNSFVSAVKIGNMPEDPGEFYTGISKKLEAAKTDYNTAIFSASSKFGEDTPEFFKAQTDAIAALHPIEKAVDEIHYVIEPDGNFSVFKNRAPNWLDQKGFDDIKRKLYTTPALNSQGQEVKLKNSKLMVRGDNDLTLHDNFRAEIPAGATPKDFSALYAMGSKLIKEWKPVEGQQFILTPEVNWRTLEMTMELGAQKPEALSAIKLGGNLNQPQPGFTRYYRGGPSEAGAQDTFDVSNSPQYSSSYGELHYTDVPNEQLKNYTEFGLPSPSTFKLPGNTKFTKFDTSGFGSLDEVQFHILDQKFQEFQKLMPDTSRAPISAVKGGSLLEKLASRKENYTPAQVLQRLNLPAPQGYAQSPVVEMFAHAKLQGMTSLNEMFPAAKNTLTSSTYTQMDMLQQHLRETLGLTDNSVVPIAGTLLKQTDQTKPLFVAANSIPWMHRADEQIITRVQAMRDVQLERLAQIDPQRAPLVTSVIGKLTKPGAQLGDLSDASNTARGVQTLNDGILSGTGQLVYQDRINDQFPTLKALQLIAQDGDKFVDNYVTQLASVNLTPRYATILAPKNKNDLFDFNRIEQAYRHGWEVEKAVPSPDGKGVSFLLTPDSKKNAQLLETHFPGEEAPQFMPDMSTTAKKAGLFPLQVSSAAGDLASAISDMSVMSGRENNALRLALGHNPISLRKFHLPTPELNKEGTWFVRNEVGNVVASYSGPNVNQNAQRAKEAADKLGQNHVAIPLETVKAEHQANDDAFFSLIDYSDQLAKTGAGIKGGLAHTEIDTGPVTLRAMIRSLQEQYLNIGIRSRAAIFEPELNYARQASQTATSDTRNNFGGINIFDRYISTMFSQAPKARPENARGFQKAYGGIESSFDKTLTMLSAHFAELTGTQENTAGAKALRAVVFKQSTQEEFDSFKKTLPSYSPFQETADWAESTFKEKSAITSKQVMANLSKVSSTMSLRFLDAGTALNNFLGGVTTMPSVVHGLRRAPHENYDNWVARTGAWGTEIGDGVMTFSANKALSNASKAFWRGELNAPMQEAAVHGYFEPEYASLSRALTGPQRPGMKAMENFVTKASYLADKSEILTRQLTWGIGYKIGKDLHGFTDERNAYIFANNFVNETIGNYSPNNKPAMFQGALGQPLGAFQTYMFNFYRRMYGNIERGDKAALMAQYAAQASVFGWKSVPGYGAWNNVFQSNHDGSDDFTSRIERRFAPGVGELLLNGTVSNIPKIWGGMQSNGIALYSRGSVDFTQPPPTLLDASKAPPMQFLAETYKGVTATVNNVFNSAGFSLQQQEEILARFSTNRALKSVMEMAAGVKTNERGTVIDNSVRDGMHVAAALMGSQTTHTRSAQEAMRRQKIVELNQMDLRASLNDHTRAIFRGGNDITVEQLQGIVKDYTKSGGNPAYLGQWFRDNVVTATEPAVQKQLESLGRSGKMLEFEDMLATLQQNQETPQPQQK